MWNSSKEHPQSCEICRRPGILLNPILVCHDCKVSLQLGCYRSVKVCMVALVVLLEGQLKDYVCIPSVVRLKLCNMLKKLRSIKQTRN
ncbi:hypothetical protein MKW98_003856 [Papaver atlanticum]|uniref:Uncharacterized protein n=1 Tax=Papaver atlanticum TaxID=357466 RepID=A0AAD4TCZ8_9MAGN|nr:hypothetical protein MKW98_003856 [Papaver atlanticum]